MVRVALLALLAGCSYLTSSFVDNDFSGDSYPIAVDTSSGALMIGVRTDGAADRIGVLDVLSPITVFDNGIDATPSISNPDRVTLLGEDDSGALTVARASLAQPQVVALHPCAADDCVVGTPSAPVEFSALIGDVAFGGDALRLHLSESQIFILPDISGDSEHRSYACDGVFGGDSSTTPFRGGGTLLLGGTEVDFTNWRITIDACLSPSPEAPLQSERGTDVLLVASTALGVSLLDESAYARYLQGHPTAPTLDTLPMDSVNLPSGPVTGHRTSIATLALVANSSSEPRSPCRQVYAHHLLEVRDCESGDDCPCTVNDPDDNHHFCTVPAITEIGPAAGIDFLIVPDDDPTIQALTTELEPDQPIVDGILANGAIHDTDVDIDYQHDRVLMRCADPSAQTCKIRPEIVRAADRIEVDACIGDTPGPVP